MNEPRKTSSVWAVLIGLLVVVAIWHEALYRLVAEERNPWVWAFLIVAGLGAGWWQWRENIARRE